MPARRRIPSLIAAALLAGCLSACGEETPTHSANDRDSGLSVAVAGDQVVVKRTSASESGTAGKAGQVYCTDDYDKVLNATEQPAPSESWYAAALITWPDKAKETTATLSHALAGRPDLCVAQMSDSSAQVIVYFDDKVKTAIDKRQTDSQREQQAGQAEDALTSAAQTAVSSAAEEAFPAASELAQSLTEQGLYTKTAETAEGVTETGTIYVVTADTTTKRVVLAIRDAEGKVMRATQKLTGDPKITTVK